MMRATLIDFGEQYGFCIYSRLDYIIVNHPERKRLRPTGIMEVWGLVDSGQIILASKWLLNNTKLFDRYDADYGLFRLGSVFAVLESDDVAEIGATKRWGGSFYHTWSSRVALYKLPKLHSYVILSKTNRRLWGTFPENAKELEALNRIVLGKKTTQ